MQVLCSSGRRFGLSTNCIKEDLRQIANRFVRHRSTLVTAAAKKVASNSKSGKRKPGVKDAQTKSTKGFAPVDPAVSIAFDAEDNTAREVFDDPQSLPAVSRERIISACLSVSLSLAALGAGFRFAATRLALPETQDLIQFPSTVSGSDALTVGAIVLVVTASRQLLLQVWPGFREASEASNQQVLTPLQGLDILVVSFAPGLSEELLFRGGIIPLIPNLWAGVLVSGVVFGVLHNSGGRNAAFAAWASCVGVLYGASYVVSSNVLVPMAAHSLANLTSALLWKQGQAKKTTAT